LFKNILPERFSDLFLISVTLTEPNLYQVVVIMITSIAKNRGAFRYRKKASRKIKERIIGYSC